MEKVTSPIIRFLFMLMLFTIAVCISCGREDEETTWMYTYEDYRVRGNSVEQTSEGGFVVGGTTYDDSLSYALWIGRVNEMGNLLWQKALRSGDACAMVMLMDGGYVISNLGFTDIIVLKIDSAGGVEWEKVFGGPRCDFASDLCATRDGGFVLLGASEMSFPNIWDKEQLILIRADASGNDYWKRTYNMGNGYIERGGKVQQTADGGFIFTGVTYPATGPKQGVLVKTNEHGYVEWVEYFDGVSAQCMCECFDQQYIVVFDSTVCKFDKHGNSVWEVPSPAPHCTARTVSGTSDIGCVITGQFFITETDIWVTKLNSEGAVEWSYTYHDIDAAYGVDIAETRDGGYIILGCTHDIDFPVSGHMVLIKTNAAGEVISP